MIRLDTPASRAVHRAASVALAIGLLAGLLVVPDVGTATAATPTAATPDIVLSTALVGQKFPPPADPPYPPDQSRDAGVYDCLPASLAMAMAILQSTTFAQPTGTGTYLVVKDGSRFAPGETITADSEHMVVRSITPNQTLQGSGFALSPDGTSVLDVSRGTDGTLAVQHAAGAPVGRQTDYASVRRFMRTQSKVAAWLGLGETYRVVEHQTDGRFNASAWQQATPDGWRDILGRELSAGRPVVLGIADARMLKDDEVFELSHAVLAVGVVDRGATILIDDPWNEDPAAQGRQFRMTADAFAAAWGNKRMKNGGSTWGWSYIAFQQTAPQASGATATPSIPTATPTGSPASTATASIPIPTPTTHPTATLAPTSGPTTAPTANPTRAPTENPTEAPTPAPTDTLPAAPTDVTATDVDNSRIRLTWTDNTGGQASYYVRHLGAEFSPPRWVTVATLGPGATTYTDTGLFEQHTYQFLIGSFNSAGTSWSANPVSATTLGCVWATGNLASGAQVGTSVDITIARDEFNQGTFVSFATGAGYVEVDTSMNVWDTFTAAAFSGSSANPRMSVTDPAAWPNDHSEGDDVRECIYFTPP
jgi:hypothetical protein